MRLLFLSRAFPPTIGGIEKQNSEVAKFLGKKVSLTLIANYQGKSFLPLFLPYAFFRLLLLAPKYDVLLLGDGVLAPIGAVLKIFFPRLTVVSIVHGLDITFAEKTGFFPLVYQWINIPSLKKLDGIICVSQDTKRVALASGVKKDRAFVVPNGIDPDFFQETHERSELEQFLHQGLNEKKIILRLGRFVRHKGVLWFIENVMPRLSENVFLIAAGGVAKAAHPGDNNVFPLCEEAIRKFGLEKRVFLFPNLSWNHVKMLLQTADLAVAPNIPIPGSMEGFGISVLEAGMNELPIVVSQLEGLQEAVSDQNNGLFVRPGVPEDFVEKINWFLADDTRRTEFGKKARAYTLEHYSWETLSQHYKETLEYICQKKSR